jgi:hypothetical protein
MFYTFDYTVTANDIVTAKHKLLMPVVTGVIHQVDVLFQSGCAHEVNVQIFDAISQVWPSNSGNSFRGDSTVISFREFYEIESEPAELIAYLWTTDTSVLFEVIIEIGILSKKILQPLSFDELLAAAAGYQ